MLQNTLKIKVDPATQGFNCGNCGSHIAIIVNDEGHWRVTCRKCGARYVSDPCEKCGQSLSIHNESRCEIIYLESMNKARCLICKEIKPLAEFPKNANGNKRRRCNTCQSAYFKSWYEKNKARRNWRKGSYTSDKDMRRKIVDESS